ncbi:polyisoprenoid-binding protein [Streptomyces fagopyri]|uniref:Polyisoprenoid-binding protein n=1 Tax=Streptomyces fagopyri TaxID=2662397 RepID=A0A5Q0LLI1_9ACTN|nr:YceI family protein [Streptomyces fagopyri]QFZ77938.1 polyisoprenoid-binding protein [Streptomyces fagopyri]
MFHPDEATVSRPAPPEEPTGVYLIDPVRSSIGFSARHAMSAHVRGNFTVFEGLLKLDGVRPARSEAYLSVQTGSVDTGCPERDARVTGPEFLDSATFPLMSFRSAGVLGAGDDRLHLAGYLRIKDAELPVHLDLAFRAPSRAACARGRVGLEGTLTPRRVGPGPGPGGNAAPRPGGPPIGDMMRLTIDISAVRTRPGQSR